MAATDVGTGSTITFQTGLFAEITSLAVNGSEVPVRDAPFMGGAGLHKLVIGRLQRPPQLVVGVNLNADKDWKAVIAAAAETVTLTFPTPSGGSAGATWVVTGKVVSFEADIPVDDVMTGTFTIQATTLPVITASS